MAAKKSSTGSASLYSEDNWRAQDDMRTLTRAAEISADNKRLAAARAEAAKQVRALQSVTGKPKPQAQSGAGRKLAGKRI